MSCNRIAVDQDSAGSNFSLSLANITQYDTSGIYCSIIIGLFTAAPVV